MQTNTIIHGDCIDTLAELPPHSIDTVITDPPAGIAFMGKKWDDHKNYKPRTEKGEAVYTAMADLLAAWELGFLTFTVDWVTAAIPAVKPGAMWLVWSLPRTSDLTQMGLRLAGLEVRDSIAHLFGQGFPKSHNIGKALDRKAGAKREVVGKSHHYAKRENKENTAAYGDFCNDTRTITAPATDAAKLWDGWGTALKPAREDWILAMSPINTTFAENALTHGVAGLHIDGARIETDDDTGSVTSGRRTNPFQEAKGYYTPNRPPMATGGHPQGRWPANVTFDEAAAALLDAQSGESGNNKLVYQSRKRKGFMLTGSENNVQTANAPDQYGDSGGASRFYYVAKASKRERTANGAVENKHPTVKPIELLKHLAALTNTPTGGVVLDPFGGSGTTALACLELGRDYILIEQDESSIATAEGRIAAWHEENQTRQLVLITQTNIKSKQ